MDIRQLRYFVGVLEAKSLSKAAAQLRIAQPALGVQIRNLERELGAKLLDRHPRGVTATEAGQRLAQQAGLLLQRFDLIRQDLVDYATNPEGPVLLYVSRNLPRVVTAAIAERCRSMFPDIQLSIVVGWQNQLNGELKESEADIVLTFRPHNNGRFISEPLVHDELLLVRSAKEARFPREISFCKAIQRTLILPGEPHFIRCLVETAARVAGVKLKLYCDVDSLEVTMELVTRGLVDTLLPLACVRVGVEQGKLRTSKIKDPTLQRTLCMLHSARQSRASAIDLVRREVRATILKFAEDQSFGWKKIDVSGNSCAAPPLLGGARQRDSKVI
jgi:LysR family transcriptional regulator, nitrogen assimilation regulatory protein